MESLCRDILILVWKCQIIRRRSIIISILELVIPIAMFTLLSMATVEISMERPATHSANVSAKIDQFVTYYSFFLYTLGLDVIYAPDCHECRKVIEHSVQVIEKTIEYVHNIKLISEPDEIKLEQCLRNNSELYSYDIISEKSGPFRGIGVVFSDLEYGYTYKIRTIDQSMVTNDVEGMSFAPYIRSYFLGTQIILDKSLLWHANVTDDVFWLFGHLPSHTEDVHIITMALYVILIFAYSFLVVSAIKDVVAEKESGTRELMRVMGVDSWMIWVQWFVYTMMIQLPVTVAATIIFTSWKPVAINAGFLIVFILFFLFNINIIAMLFAVSCLFYKVTAALSFCLISWFLFNCFIFIKVFVNEPDDVISSLEPLLSLFPLVNLCWALSSLWSFQTSGVQWTWNILFKQGFTKFPITVGTSIIMFIASTALNVFILIYLDAIFPGPYGVPKPVTFVCKWIRDLFTSSESFEYSEIIHECPENFEPVDKNTKVGIMLRGLMKNYGLFKKTLAVENVDLDIYEGEIMALLGHNGAGKTTTMSMITGMTAPTKGVIVFEGQNITVNKKVFRKTLGLCPQHNLYFSKLTVIEHLMFFGMLKGMSYFQAKNDGKKILFCLNILDKATTRAAELSGGMKRRLCLAISLTGNPKVLILDEPTSGLDPENRRSVWDVILRMRGERTVLITTHFMEEADVLGDRIAIMDHGRVVCSGTSMFLKKLFGAGYQIHVLKTTSATVADVTNVVKQYIPQPQVNVISVMQVDYIVKEDLVERFPELLSALEGQKSSLGITGVTITCASMEDVFLKVAALPIGNSSTSAKDDQPLAKTLNLAEFDRLEGGDLTFQHINTLVGKRYICLKRHIFSLLTKALIFWLLMILICIKTPIKKEKNVEQKPLLLNLNLYPGTTVLMAYDKDLEYIRDIGEKVASLLSGRVRIFPAMSDLEYFLKKESTENSLNYVQNILFALTFTKDNITVRYHSGRNVHAPAIAVSFLTNVLYLNKTNTTGIIQTINHPFVNTDATEACGKLKAVQLIFDIVFVYPCLLLFSLCFILFLSDSLSLITEERVTGFKYQQYIVGASPLIYWSVNVIFDFCVYFILTVILIMVFSIFGPKATLMHINRFGLLLLVFFLQGWGGLSLTYIFSFFFDSPGMSYALYSILMICCAVFPALVVSTGLLALFPIISSSLFILILLLLSLNPIAATILCARYILKAIILDEYCRVCTDEMCPINYELFKMPKKDDPSGILLYLIVLILTSIAYPIIVLLIDSGLVKKIGMLIMSKEPEFSSPPDADEDVKFEIGQVKALKYENKETPLRVESLEKKYIYGPRAVDRVSFVVMKGDCFGLLGVNGAGKSTTFKMLTAEILPDRGDAYIYSLSVKTDRSDYITSVGYCPQFDAMLPSLTGEETLSLFAKLRGVPSAETRDLVTLWLDAMGILEHGNKHCGSYSGGTKRKLNTAIALIGSPEVVFMDEPTTGVDPASRRKLWTVIKETQKQGQAVVLTSHSMEECEALCTRLTIMVGGVMRCIGSVEYLKTKYGKGFTVLLKLNECTGEELMQLKEDFRQLFLDSSIKDEHKILIHYTVLDPKLSLSKLFANLLKFKRDHSMVADFTAYNTTLEELFLSFAKGEQMR